MRRRLVRLGLALTAAVGVAGLPTAAVAQDGPPGAQIVGGTDVPNGKYPFMAALQDHSDGETAIDRFQCGGTLINPQKVLTAAHCIPPEAETNDPVALAQLSVIVGRTRLSNASQGQERGVASIAVFPCCTFDVAVIFLDAPVTGIDPIRLVTPGTDALERPGTRLTAAGWGDTVQREPGQSGPPIAISDRLQEVEVPVVSDEECEIAYAGGYEPANDMCAGHFGKGVCFGDSGGPLFKQVPGRPLYIQAGMAFSTVGCGAMGFPSVFTQLSNESIGAFIRNPPRPA